MDFLVPIFAFIAVAVIIPFARKLARSSGFVDAPGGRKRHDKPVPPIGGLVIFPVFMVAATFAGFDFTRHGALFIGIIILLMTGAVDEKLNLDPWIKFFIHIGVSLIVVLFGEARIYQLGNILGLGDFWLSFMSVPFSVAAMMLLINAVNLIDGLDGLAAGFGLIAVGWVLLACAYAGNDIDMIVLWPLAGALAGFLIHNMRNPWRRKASVFLGDPGSLCLGLTLGYFCISLAHFRVETLAPISVAWILALPIMDTCAQFYRRARAGKHPFSADRGHFHHHFINAGIPVSIATPMILFVSFILGGFGYLGFRAGLPEYVLAFIWAGLLIGHMAISRRPAVYILFLSRLVRCLK
jgi:UDP-GlcNAc:undecaprenyl-phosphate GlcNAc-1-phosphate transferase